jgi:TorA maturation chaperone TorD
VTTTAIDLPRLVNLLSDIYMVQPTREIIEEWRIAVAGDVPEFAAPLKLALDAAADLASEGKLEDLQTEYTRLMIGPAALPCPPWESIYTSPDKLMMQEAYHKVAALYAEAGLVVQQADVLPDHIGAELHFLALLLDRVGHGTEQEQEAVLALADRLLDDHLNRWVGRFTQDLENAAHAVLYMALAQVTRKMVSFLQE